MKPQAKRVHRLLATMFTIMALVMGQNAQAINDVNSWAELQTLLTNSSTDAVNPTVIMLSSDIVATSTDSYLNIPAGHHVIIDLNGHMIDRNLTEPDNNGQVFYVHGGTDYKTPSSLTIRDSQGGGTITGGYPTSWNGGGAFFVTYSSTLTIEGGTITGNKSAQYGGGAITATNRSTVRMTGGSITGNVGNTSNDDYFYAAGAICLKEQSHFYLSGGSITDNRCGGHTGDTYGKDDCGGIGFDSQHDYVNRVHLSGTYTLSGNLLGSYSNGELTNSIPSDYLHTQKNVIVIEDAISPTAPTVITVSDKNNTKACFTSGWGNLMTADPATCFTLGSFYNTNGKVIGLRNDSLVIDTPLAALWHEDGNHDGSAEHPYLINTTAGLDLLAKQVNGTDGYAANEFSDKHFLQTASITYDGTENNYTPIGNNSHYFRGHYDGDGKIISGININSTGNDIGLFGHVGTGGTVQNVILTEGTITGNENTGAIVGHNEGTLTANYYRGCTVNSQTTNVGTGNGDIDGARSVHTLTFEENSITTTTPPDVNIGNTDYYATGTEITLNYTVPTGYIFCNFRKNGSSVGNSFIMPSQSVNVGVYTDPKWGIDNGNDGSQEKPYVISNFDDLNLLAMSVNGTVGNTHYDADDCKGKYFILERLVEDISKKFNNLTAIGTPDHPFNGIFDGHEKVIKGIRIDSGDDYQGLFGYIGSMGTVKNVIVENAVIKNTSGNESHHVGAIIGAVAEGGTITNNYYFSCTIKNDSVNVGTGSGDVDDALGLHMIIPGEGVVVTGTKHFYINDTQTAFDYGDDYYPVGSTITLSRAEGYLLGNSGYTATKVNSTETIPVTENNGVYTFVMPRIRVIVDPIELDKATYWHADADHDGTSEERAYIISTTTGLNMLANHLYDGHDCEGIFFRQGGDIAYDPAAADANDVNFLGIGGDFGTRLGTYFNGTFDGQGYTISGTRIHRSTDCVGFFGQIGPKGTVKNVILSNGRVKGGNFTGGIAGNNMGTIKNCIVIGTTIVNYGYTFNNGTISILNNEYSNNGVIVGISSGTISNNYYQGCTYTDGKNTKNSGIGLGDNDSVFEHSGEDQDDDDGAMYTDAFPLLSTGNNDHVLANNYNIANKSFTIAGRTFYKDGDWNTICLPFSLSAEQIAANEQFAGADIRALSNASFENGTLTLNFTPAAPAEGAVTSIQAGTPYLIRWEKNKDYESMPSQYDFRNPTVTGITITSTTPSAVTSDKVTFQGTFENYTFTNEDRSVFFVGANNQLYWPQPRLTDPTKPFCDELTSGYNPWIYPSIGAFRGYFKLNGLTIDDSNAGIRAFVLSFGDEATGITYRSSETNDFYKANGTSETNWYDLNGRRLNGKPTAKGLYIINGKKTVIK